MTPRWAVLTLLTALACGAASAQGAWQPSLYVVGSLDRGRGEAFTARAEPRDDAAASLGLGLDGRREGDRGGWQASFFGLAHDPAAASDRGLLVAGRVRAARDVGGGFRLTLDDSAKLQRRDRLELSDLQRNELALGVERRLASGRTLGLLVSDRRRGVVEASVLGFERQALAASLGLPLGARRELQLQAGPQRFAADTARGWRLGLGAELLGAGRGGVFALRLAWLEPLGETRLATPGLGPAGAPADQAVGPSVGIASVGDLSRQAPPALPRPAAGAVEPGPGLLGEGLIVDPLESDEDDWDLGRRKQELLALGSWKLGERSTLVTLVRLVRERGPDLLSPDPAARVEQQRWAARLSWRRGLSARAALVLQGAWQGRTDGRPGFDYTRVVVAASLEVRP